MTIAKNILELLEAHVDHKPNESFLYHKYTSRYEAISFNALYQKVEQFSLGLASLGVSEQDNVGILSTNRPEWVVADLSILSLKAVTVPLYPTLSSKEILHLLNHARIEILILEDQEMIDRVLTIKDECKFLKKIIFIQTNVAAIPELCVSFANVISLGLESSGVRPSLKQRIKDISSDQLATIIYTSGTTGDPKGVMLTHHNFLSNISDVVDAFALNENDVVLSFLPLSHVFERTVGYYTLLAIGGRIYYARSVQTVIEDVVDAKPTVFISVPRLYEKIQAGVLSKLSFVKKLLFFAALQVGKSVSLGKPWHDGKEFPFIFRLCQKVVFKKGRR